MSIDRRSGFSEQFRQLTDSGKPLRSSREDAKLPVLLFVCTGNICRSAYAEQALKSRLVADASAAALVGSAGTHALVGRPLDTSMDALLTTRYRSGVSVHCARQLNDSIVERADIIVAMASEHKAYLLRHWPSAAKRTVLASGLDRAATAVLEHSHDRRVSVYDALNLALSYENSSCPDVIDPYRQSQDVCRLVADELDGMTERLGRLYQLSRLQTNF